MNHAYVVNTTQYERFIECIAKGVYGLSEGMLRKVGSFLKNSDINDTIFLKLDGPTKLVAGPFYIFDKPTTINMEKSYGKCFKLAADNISQDLPWWVAEGFNWLIFFKQGPESKYAEFTTEINIPSLGNLSDLAVGELKNFLTEKGRLIKELLNDRTPH